MNMLPIHQRLAELHTIQKRRALTEYESDEVSLCLEANSNYAHKYALLCNLSAIASEVDDIEWLNDCLIKIDKLEIEYKLKKPASIKKTD
jgi:hypothetical protein